LYHVAAVGCRRAGDCDWFAPIEIDVEPVWPDADRFRAIAAGPGVTIDTGGAPLVEHSEISYPAEAVRNGVGGLVVLKVTPNRERPVQAVEVVEGPEALQKDAIKGALTWRFTQKAWQKPRNVEIRFDPVEAERAIAAQPAGRRQPTMTLPQTPGPITPQRIKVPAAEQAAKLITRTDPVYPPMAKAAHIQGVVHLSVILGRDGRVIISRDGHAMVMVLKGPPLLAPAAMEAVQQWQYSPTLVNGTAVEVATEVDVEFFQLK
jgi:TonB family protein